MEKETHLMPISIRETILEVITPEDLETNQLQVHDTLHADFFAEDMRLKGEVRTQLLKIAQSFIHYLKIDDDTDICDIRMTGSMANFNYNGQSDIDLHILIDFTEVGEDVDLVKDMFDAKKNLWNENREIEILGHEVECYVEHSKEKHSSKGVYSVLNDEWVVKPQKMIKVVDFETITHKASQIANQIEKLEEKSQGEGAEAVIEKVDKLKDKIKKMRQAGLDAAGENSTENLVFKILRYNGYLERLKNLKMEAINKDLSMFEE